ncbi:MAG TPA: hypothetical protein VLQ45_09615 [Thermoanaerobaculia bacterium]|nr:hypothetical protein [Thermoanaerobaculia bacterium]
MPSVARDKLAEIGRKALLPVFTPPEFETRQHPVPSHHVEEQAEDPALDGAATLLCARLIRDKGGRVSELEALCNPEMRRRIEARLHGVGLWLAMEGEWWAVYLQALGD